MKIAVGLDGSQNSWKALTEAIEQCRQKAGDLHILSVQESSDASYSASEVLAADKTSHVELEKVQTKARLLAREKSVNVHSAIIPGSSVAVIVEYVKKHQIDLLIIGDKGHSSIWGALLGTTAEKIVRLSPCSVLIVR